MLRSVSQKFPQCCLWNGSSVRLIDSGPLSSFQGRSSVSCFVFPGLLHDLWCDVFGFVPTSSSTFQILWEASHLWGFHNRQCICSVISLHSGMFRAVHPQEFLKVDVVHWHIPVCSKNLKSGHHVFPHRIKHKIVKDLWIQNQNFWTKPSA